MNNAAALAEAKASSEALLRGFKELVGHQFANERTRQEIVQHAYELGVAFGCLSGKVEAANQLLKPIVPVAMPVSLEKLEEAFKP